jgi:uncharacterized protein YhhL (DUF1145 family)
MKLVKSGFLILYVILIYVAITVPLTLPANISLGVLVLLAALHLVECFMYKDIIRQAPGSPLWHLLNIFLFGIVHMMNMKVAIRLAKEKSV